MTEAHEARGAAAWVVRHRRWMFAVWIVVALLLAPAAARVEQVLDVSARVPASESARVEAMLANRFASPFAHYAVLVLTGVPSPATAEGRDALGQAIAAVRSVRGVTSTASYLDASDASFLPDRGAGTFVLVGLEADREPLDAMVPRLRAATERATVTLRHSHPRATMRWTGDVALNYDLRRTSAAEAQRAEMRALPLTLTMLLLAFGAVAAAALPAVSGILAVVVALGIAALAASRWPLSILLQNVVTMLGLGLGVDYALLIVSRFREELAAGHDGPTAAARAGRTAGHTVVVSGAAVLVGFVALLLVPLDELRGVATGGAIVVVVSVLLATTLLPALLATLGTRVNAGRLRRHMAGGALASAERWRRWGRWLSDHPWRVLAVAGLPVVVLASAARDIDTSLPRSGWLPHGMESARALDDLGSMGRSGVVQSMRVVVELPAGASALGTGWTAVARLSTVLAADPRVSRVQSLPSLLHRDAADPMAVALSPASLVNTFVSTDRRLAVIEVLPRSAIDFRALTLFARDLRALDAGRIAGLPGTRLYVGGMAAFNADYEDAISSRLPLVVLLVVGGTFVALMVGFRSVLIAIKALVLNLLSVAAALGAVVLVFQKGHGSALLGVPHATGSLFPALPALVFCIVFGLSLDYEVFLVARVAEARRAGLDDREALAEGLARTGGVITSAAAIMVVVFAAFTLGDFLMVKVLGFALATAVLLDATIVRIAVGPALFRLAGRWNWWPGERARPRRPSGPDA
jgi:RND superfamily putative drug exporter